jgi:hypothetical protein
MMAAALIFVASIANALGAETFIPYRYSPLGLHYLAVQKLYAAPTGASVWQCAYWADPNNLIWRKPLSKACPVTLEEA